MKKERLFFLHEEFKKAIQFCNEIDENKPFSDSETTEDNFWADVFMLAFFPICTDRNISEIELEKFNTLMAECNFDFRVNICDSKAILKLFKKHKFEVPKTLIAFSLRSAIDILETEEDKKDKRIEYNLGYLDFILCHYADLMVSMVDEITPQVKETILKCLTVCCNDISKTLSVPFAISENVMDFIENPNVADY